MGGKSIISNSYLEDIGDAIRYKKGTEETFYPSQMGDAIRSIEGIVPVGSIEIDANGVYNVTDKAEAVVSVQPDLRPLSVSENGTYQPDGFDGFSQVSVDTGIKCVTGKFRVEQELVWTNALEKSVPHNLGAVPSMIVIWTHNNDVENKGGRTIVSIWVDRDELALPWIEETLIPYVANFFLPWGSDLQVLNVAKSTHKTAGLKYKPTATEFHLISDSVYKNYFPGTYYYLLVACGWESYANNHMSDDDIYVVN